MGTPKGWLGEVKAALQGHALDEVKRIAKDIDAVLHNLKRQVEAGKEIVNGIVRDLDGQVLRLEAFIRREATHFLGDPVGNALANILDLDVDVAEGLFVRGPVSLVMGLQQLLSAEALHQIGRCVGRNLR